MRRKTSQLFFLPTRWSSKLVGLQSSIRWSQGPAGSASRSGQLWALHFSRCRPPSPRSRGPRCAAPRAARPSPSAPPSRLPTPPGKVTETNCSQHRRNWQTVWAITSCKRKHYILLVGPFKMRHFLRESVRGCKIRVKPEFVLRRSARRPIGITS